MSIAFEELNKIQKKLKVSKNHFNKFGGYNYRNAEDILEAVKPLCEKTVCNVTDELVLIGDRYYIKATAKLTNIEDKNDFVLSNGFARESESKKGMDDSQITGSTSSYARKYALNGLFCIDDTKDADSFDNTDNNSKNKTTTKNKQQPQTQPTKPPKQQPSGNGKVNKGTLKTKVSELLRTNKIDSTKKAELFNRIDKASNENELSVLLDSIDAMGVN